MDSTGPRQGTTRTSRKQPPLRRGAMPSASRALIFAVALTSAACASDMPLANEDATRTPVLAQGFQGLVPMKTPEEEQGRLPGFETLKVRVVNFKGAGCVKATLGNVLVEDAARAGLDMSMKYLSFRFDDKQFIARTTKQPLKERDEVTCQLTLAFRGTAGVRFASTSVDYEGYAKIEDETSADILSQFEWRSAFLGGAERPRKEHHVPAPYDDAWIMTHATEARAVSKCLTSESDEDLLLITLTLKVEAYVPSNSHVTAISQATATRVRTAAAPVLVAYTAERCTPTGSL